MAFNRQIGLVKQILISRIPRPNKHTCRRSRKALWANPRIFDRFPGISHEKSLLWINELGFPRRNTEE
ncbi:hypothetical protein D3C81_829270 [compost metagenome]